MDAPKQKYTKDEDNMTNCTMLDLGTRETLVCMFQCVSGMFVFFVLLEFDHFLISKVSADEQMFYSLKQHL